MRQEVAPLKISKRTMRLYHNRIFSEITPLSIALVLPHGRIFAEPESIDIDRLLPDEFFDWEEIGV